MGLQDTVGIANTFALFNQCSELLANEITDFVFTASPSPETAIQLRDFLNTKPYIGTHNRSAIVTEDSATGLFVITVTLFNMNIANQQDWLTTMTGLNLSDKSNTTKRVILNVPAGEEKYWILALQADSRVKYAGYNLILHVPGGG